MVERGASIIAHQRSRGTCAPARAEGFTVCTMIAPGLVLAIGLGLGLGLELGLGLGRS
ncbi:hypothetical protein [Leucobacter alluvii]|uniref:hypothetical protein n=1 Tax=Leucobacter alluvii TaxID=340321 RepID=UPI0031F86413